MFHIHSVLIKITITINTNNETLKSESRLISLNFTILNKIYQEPTKYIFKKSTKNTYRVLNKICLVIEILKVD